LTTSQAFIGNSGRGTIDQSAGSYVAQGQGLRLGLQSGGSGTYNLSGDGSLETFNTYVGNNGTGNFNQSGGSHLIAEGGSQLYLGFLQDSVGTYTLSGGSLSASEHEFVGYIGTGNFVHSGGTNTIPGVLEIGTGLDGTGTYTLSGSGQVSAGQILVGDNGTGSFNQSGGSVTTPSMSVGYLATALGTYSLSNGTLSVGNQVVGQVAAGTESQSGGTFVQNGGSHYVGALYVAANAGGTGSYTLNGGSLVTSANASIGYEGTGNFAQGQGSHTAGIINLGNLAGSRGTYSVNGGIVNAGDMHIGGSADGAGGTGLFSISGSNTNVTVSGTIKVHNTPNTSLNLNGGTLNVGAIDVGGVPSKFNWSGGTLNITGDVVWSAGEPANSTGAIFGANLQLASNRTLRVTGDETIGGNGQFTLTMVGTATHTVTGTLTLMPGGTILGSNSSTLGYANFVQAGGTIQSFFRNTANFHHQSGTIQAQFVNAGTLSIASTMTVNGQMQNEGSVTVGGGQTLSVLSQFTNSGNFTLAGGTLGQTGGAFTNLPGGVLTAHGTINGQLANQGTLIVDGVLNLTGSSPITNTGVIQGAGTIANTTGSSINNNAGGAINATTPGGTLAINQLGQQQAGATITIGPTSTLSITNQWSNAGLVTLQGPSARLTGGGIINNTGTIQGAGTVTAQLPTSLGGIVRSSGGELIFTANSIQNSPSGQIQVTAGSSMMFLQGLSFNSGTISVTGGVFDNNNRTLSNSGTINGHGTVRTGGLTNQSGRIIAVGGGDMEIFGNVINNGVVNIQTGRTAYFFNPVSGSGSFTGGGTAVFLASLSPGNSPGSVSFGGNAELVGGTSLNIELGGIAPGTGYDRIQVAGRLSIGGILSLSLINGFAPSAGDTFDILDWGTLDGTFSDVVLPNLGATKAWDTSSLYTSGVLSVLSVALPGDHNLDGTVDAADYVMWRKTNVGGAQGYTDWYANFGASSGGGGSADRAAQATVPEPAAAAFLLSGLLVACAVRRNERGC
jgi:hypothetical protein